MLCLPDLRRNRGGTGAAAPGTWVITCHRPRGPPLNLQPLLQSSSLPLPGLGQIHGQDVTELVCGCCSPTLPAADGPLILRMDSGDEAVKGSHWDNALYLAAGWDPYQLVELGVAGSAALSGTAKPRTQKKLPASLDVFGWCTWDAFYSRVSALGAPRLTCPAQLEY